VGAAAAKATASPPKVRRKRVNEPNDTLCTKHRVKRPKNVNGG
jgi:hypothetical protein